MVPAELVGDFTRVLEDFFTKGKFSCTMGIRKRLVLKAENSAGVTEYRGKTTCRIKKRPKTQERPGGFKPQCAEQVLILLPPWAGCSNPEEATAQPQKKK